MATGRLPAQNSQGLGQQVIAVLAYPFTACLPSTSASAAQGERQGLLSGEGGGGDGGYEDTDAISLLSNIADRSRRRNRATRRRERWNKSAAALGCGLFGRSKGQIQRRNVTAGDGERGGGGSGNRGHARNASVESLAASESMSVESATSLTDDESVGRFGATSGDEDAGMLEDETIAELSADTVRQEDMGNAEQEQGALRARQAIEEATAAVKLKKEMERQAAEAESAMAEEAARTKAEENRLASEEEAAIAKARRKAERKAIKQGLLRSGAEAQIGSASGRRKLTEAEAEAAAGGFDFAEEMPEDDYGQFIQHHSPMQEAYDFIPEQQQEVVHHHHYYHEPQQDDSGQHYIGSPTFNVPTLTEERAEEEGDAVAEEDEEDADIAGLGFSKNRRKRADRDGSYASRSNGSGSGSRQSGSAQSARRFERSTAHSGSSTGARRESGQHLTADSAGGSTGGKQSYRERPRRHERTKSQSTGSGAGRVLREGLGGRIIASPTIPEAESMQSMMNGAQAEDRADAAAGGFDDFLVPQQQQESNVRFLPSLSPTSSASGSRSERRREGPHRASASRGLNAPRNPQGGSNIFTRPREADDEVDGL